MGVPRGVTVIAGGGFHGKSTLLQAIQEGVYNHIPGDGRELCVSDASAVKVRAKTGRYVPGVDISAFVRDLPDGSPTDRFFTENASGSTSQAASIVEAVELGARVVLLDEDTCAVNLLARDRRMQLLVGEHEPLRGYVDHARRLARDGVSTIIVTGALGAFLGVADLVLELRGYRALDRTGEARRVVEACPTGRVAEAGPAPAATARIPDPGGVDPTGQYGHRRVAAPTVDRLVFGTTEVDLGDVEQLLERAQTHAVGEAADRARQAMDGTRSLPEVVQQVMGDVADGVDALDTHAAGDLAAFRTFELAACLHRLRGLRMHAGGRPAEA
jgi:predicted ABC-class ATPase